MGTNWSLNILCERNCSVQIVRGKKKNHGRNDCSPPFGVSQRFAWFFFDAAFLLSFFLSAIRACSGWKPSGVPKLVASLSGWTSSVETVPSFPLGHDYMYTFVCFS